MAKRAAKLAEGQAETAPETTESRLKRALAVIKDSGIKGGIASSDEMKEWLEYERVSWGFKVLDTITDGGAPKGKFTIIAGPEQSCKTTVCLYMIANRMREKPDAIWCWVDAENSFDLLWAKNAGIDLTRLVVLKPAIMEDLMQTVVNLVDTGSFDGVVVDSVGSLTPLAEVKKKKDDKTMTRTMTDDTVAALAKKIGQFFRMVNEPVFRTKTCCILIGHVYVPIGNDYQEFEVKGGNALKHWGHLRLMTRRRKGNEDKTVKKMMPSGQEKDVFVAYEAVFTVDKTRQGAHQGHQVSIPFVFGKGLSNTKSVIDMAFAYGVIQTGGAWCSHPLLPDGKMQGREKTADFFANNSEAFSALLDEVGQKVASADVVLEPEPPAETAMDDTCLQS